MKIRFLLTPSRLIQGLPEQTPKAGDTVEVENSLGLKLIQKNIAVPVETEVKPKPKFRGEPKKPKLKTVSQKEDQE